MGTEEREIEVTMGLVVGPDEVLVIMLPKDAHDFAPAIIETFAAKGIDEQRVVVLSGDGIEIGKVARDA